MAMRQRTGRPQTKEWYRTNEYIEGNTVRKLSAVPDREPYRRPDREIKRRKRTKSSPVQQTGWDAFSLLFMAAGLCVALCVCVSYLRVQHDVVTMNKEIASIESQLIELKNKNDAAYSKVNASVDLAYIYEVATKELGMVHPVENQVFSYKNLKNDYVRQYGDIPETSK